LGHGETTMASMKESIKRLPPWLVEKTRKSGKVHGLKASLRARGLHTVCESARCPNLGKCFEKPTATFLILGDACTRNCAFCAVTSAKPGPVDPREPERLAEQAAELKLKHVVITSVTRDDLEDGGAMQFADCARAVKALLPKTTVEVLTPDFAGKTEALPILAGSPIDLFNHNLETVPRLYTEVRPGADYLRSLELLRKMKELAPSLPTKSGLMVGMGETEDELRGVFEDLAENQVDAVTVGQYLRPSLKHLPVFEYLHPDWFERIRQVAREAGIRHVACAPLVRSSFGALELFEKIRTQN
jgi:lipoyl synthase